MANRIPKDAIPRVNLAKYVVLKNLTQVVLIIRVMSSPNIKQLKPAIKPYWGSIIDETELPKLVKTVLKVV